MISLAAFLFFLSNSILFSILSFIPIFILVDKIMLMVCVSIKPKADCPMIKLKNTPVEHATSIVISAFCSGVEEYKRFLFHAESILSVNKDDNINCILLIDTPSSSEPVSELDEQLKKYHVENNARDDLILFINSFHLSIATSI